MVDLFQFGFKEGNLYEILATTWYRDKKSDEISPNTACMGIRILDRQHISIHPYPTTKTYENIKNTGLVVINIINNMQLFAIAALKHQSTKNPQLKGVPRKDYDFYDQEKKKLRKLDISAKNIPFIAKSWGVLVGKVTDQEMTLKSDELGEKSLTTFQIEIIFGEKRRESFNLINRAQNLALETIIIATRIKIAAEDKNEDMLLHLQKKARDNIKNIKRFGKNNDALQAIKYVKQYLKSFGLDL
ncbi:MAG: DUF447 domain-containing protein [Promethearchaeia archaeon]